MRILKLALGAPGWGDTSEDTDDYDRLFRASSPKVAWKKVNSWAAADGAHRKMMVSFGHEAMPVLMSWYETRSRILNAFAVRTMMELDRPGLLNRFARDVKGDDLEAQARALIYLFGVDDPRAVLVFTHAAASPSPDVSRFAFEALEKRLSLEGRVELLLRVVMRQPGSLPALASLTEGLIAFGPEAEAVIVKSLGTLLDEARRAGS